MDATPLSIIEATVIRTPSQRVALVAAGSSMLADEADASRYRDSLAADVFPGLDVVLLGTAPSGDVRFLGPARAVASLAGLDMRTLRWHSFELRRPA
jgi:hypothetical protein